MSRVKREDEKKKKKGQELLTDTLKARNYLKKKRRYKNWFIEREWENRGEAQLST